MTPKITANHAASQVPPRGNIGLHGAFWTRCLICVLRIVPRHLALILVWPITFAIYLAVKVQRRAVLSNLQALRPDFGPIQRWWAGALVFVNFALTYLDRLWVLHFGKEIEWDVPHLDRFEQLRACSSGVLIFTIHSGNYDIGATLFARKFGRRLHTVRAPEQTQELQMLREEELRRTEQSDPMLRVHYNFGDNHLGMELCRVLRAGDVVAVQGDRVLSAVSPIVLMHEDCLYQIPKGPLVLAEISRVPCQPIFLQRIGPLHYRIHVGECFMEGNAKVRVDDIGRRWLSVLHRYLQEHWDQWFVFEPLIQQVRSFSP
jgi:predicted LPLAT superfamily acyltransferase